jgi:hypothetical protein
MAVIINAIIDIWLGVSVIFITHNGFTPREEGDF